ncbi:Alkaline/neutral invertase CINV2 [Platanthera guangdongensis]|uniref:Alkaline/neutral invertase n=1 Tax=Platanthera guangdongensis TaxID=2320717 RepID=A0ABR2MBV6_9ASPA
MAASKASYLSRIIKGFAGAPRFFRNYSLSRPPESQLFTGWPLVGLSNWFSSDSSPARRLLPDISAAGVGFRRLSTSEEPAMGEKAFERIYIPAAAPVADMPEVDEGCDVDLPKPKIPQYRESTETEKEAWSLLKRAVVNYCGTPVGTVAANDPTEAALNYDQVFIRDFVPAAIAFLLKGDSQIVRNFILHTLQLQSARDQVAVDDDQVARDQVDAAQHKDARRPSTATHCRLLIVEHFDKAPHL